MLWTFFVWVYITVFCFSIGLAIKHATQGVFRSPQSIPFVLLPLFGLGLLTIVTTFLSLFLPMNNNVHGALLIAVLVYIVLDWSFIRQQLHELVQQMRLIPRGYWLLILGFVLLLTLFASLPSIYFAYDTGLYHAQAIEWIQQFKVVPGLAHFHLRLGFNSTWLVISALFGSLLHGFNGWFLLWCILFFMYDAFGQKCQTIHAVFSLALLSVISFLSVFYVYPYQITTPSTDLPAFLWMFVSVVLFLQYRAGERNNANQWLIPTLTLTVLLSITTKLSTAPVGLLLLYPVLQMSRQKNYRFVISQIAMSLLVLVPWFARNIIMSGYLIFPLTFGGSLFAHYDWQVPKAQVLAMQQTIEWWAKLAVNGASLREWLPRWLTHFRRSTMLADSKIILAMNLGYMACAFTQWRMFVRTSLQWLWPVYGICVLGLVFWFTSAPDIRFGVGFITLTLTLLTMPLIALVKQHINHKTLIGILITLAIFLLLTGGEYPLTPLRIQNLITPSAYPEAQIQPQELSGKTIFVTVNGSDWCWDQFPCTPTLGNIELRGSYFLNGFRSSSDEN